MGLRGDILRTTHRRNSLEGKKLERVGEEDLIVKDIEYYLEITCGFESKIKRFYKEVFEDRQELEMGCRGATVMDV